MKYIIVFIYICLPLLFAQDSVQIDPIDQGFDVTGFLTFDWSGHRGIYHQSGFPGWGTDRKDELLFFDSNFTHWYRRYSFPFTEPLTKKRDESGVQSSIWYRTGDYFLDEFAFDIYFLDESNHSLSFQALKRNFEDQLGLLGPQGLPGGTIQQNYRFLLTFPQEENKEWLLSSAYFKTTDGIATPSEMGGWEKGASRLDRVLANQLSYRSQSNKVSYHIKFNTFSQRLQTSGITAVPQWGADLISYTLQTSVMYPSISDYQLYFEALGKYSALRSDSLGNQSRTVFSGMGGIQKRFHRFFYHIGFGSGFVYPDRQALIFDAVSRYSMKGLDFMMSINRSLHSLPYQFSGKTVNWHNVDSTTWYRIIAPDTSAISQKRTVGKAGIIHQSQSRNFELGVFVSSAAPHYYFEKQKNLMLDTPDTIFLQSQRRDAIQGIFWNGEINYFRKWWLSGKGVSLIENKKGWGNGIHHEGTVALLFQESLFQKRMDIHLKLWTKFWIGRNGYVWDPILSMGYYDTSSHLFHQDTFGLLNYELRGIISSLEISYSMINVLYAGQSLIRSLLGDSITENQFAFTASPLLPPMGRLSYITIQWHFRN